MRRARVAALTLAALARSLMLPVYAPRPPVFSRFLVVPQLTRIGDIVAATPVFDAIKAAHPDAEIVALVSRKASGILEADPRISLIYYEDYKNNLFALARALRARHFDAALLLTGTPLALALAYLAEVPLRSTLTRRPAPLLERIMARRLATHKHRYGKGGNLDAFYLAMLADLGIAPRGRRKLFTTPAGEEEAERLMAPLARRIGIVLSAGNRIKEWGDARFIELARLLAARDERILFIPGPLDEGRVRSAAAAVGPMAAAAPVVALAELPSLLSRLALFISADTGPLHVAEAMGVPTIDVIGPVAPGELTPPSTAVVLPEGVAPTIFAFHPAGPAAETLRAAEAISVERVFAAACALLDKR